MFCAGAVMSCSDGGGNSGIPQPAPTSPAPPPPTPTTGPQFTPGVFAASSQFINRCENPRSGVDIEGNPFPDRAGSTLEENFYLRSWTNETYLFRTEVTDQNPANFSDPLSYFDELRSFELTPSGRMKDDFHFVQTTEEFLAARNSAPSASYGIRFIVNAVSPPRDFRVAFTEPGSPAAELVGGEPNFQRGDRIIEVDGVDFINAPSAADVDAINAGLFPANAGEIHNFVLENVNGVRRNVMITSANVGQRSVNRLSIINTATGPVGYVNVTTFSPFASEEQIFDAMKQLKTAGINDLVLDLRYNGGGLLAVASQLSYMIAGDGPTSGRIFERLRFNDAAGNLNPVTGQVNQPTPFIDRGVGFSLTEGTALPTLDLPRVFVLSTGDTCSASESVINSLRGINIEVILIGDTTCGKPFGFFPQNNCGFTYFTIQFQGTNDVGFGDYTDGFIPNNSVDPFGVRIAGCQVADDLTKDLGDITEGLLAAALGFRDTGSCPPLPVTASAPLPIGSIAETSAISMPAVSVMDINRDMMTRR